MRPMKMDMMMTPTTMMSEKTNRSLNSRYLGKARQGAHAIDDQTRRQGAEAWRNIREAEACWNLGDIGAVAWLNQCG